MYEEKRKPEQNDGLQSMYNQGGQGVHLLCCDVEVGAWLRKFAKNFHSLAVYIY